MRRTPIRTLRAPSARGYTLLEVMMSLAVLAIGATGIVALQKTTAFGNANARNIGTANNIAAGWAERLRSDGTVWTQTPTGDTLATTTWLQNAGGVGAPTAWFPPAMVVDRGSPRADVLGADLYDDDDEAQAFCTHIRLTRLYPTLIRAEIRVFWDRDSNPITCDEDPDDVSDKFGQYGFVYVSTGIHENVLPE